jgi:aryl-alcohol dehydrogenase-like predicted oxidoreductase
MGLGAGGPSRLGQRYDRSEADSVAIIRQALDAGVNFIDTAEAYQTESIVGQAIRGIDRDRVVLSTKKSTGQRISPADVRASLEASLKRLGVDYIDIYHLHGVVIDQYDYLLHEIVPVLHTLRQQGKIGHIGITEHFGSDTQHRMLQRAVRDEVWDVMMVGFNLLNQSARESVLAHTIRQDVGVLVMFAVRRALRDAASLRAVVAQLVADGLVDADAADPADPLGFALGDGGAVSLTDAAYRFCLYEPGTHVILSGTGNPDHLRANIASFARPPLPAPVADRLRDIFRRVDTVSGQ